jgi:CRP-like cAMP-binding protein
MDRLTRIQMAVCLQGVDLFTYCNAEQMMRIACIAQQCSFAPREVIYRAQDPAESMYCVARGSVCLSTDGHSSKVGPAGTFGVAEILSDRLRQAKATALEETLTLAIDTEDFFELLSNNIEIVKALFRQLLRPAATQNRTQEVTHDAACAN